ncbi:traB domain-containing protein-like [Rhopilema esculentum]|uniref:traB domain-containing protein-like n=1 Tax=Rhopilema esculentum TaxID=499914 RepID=UPI0031DB5E35|eukprot:gene854-10602_t
MEGEHVRDDREGSDAQKTETNYNADEEIDRDEVSITEKIAIAAEQNVDGLASTDDKKHDTEIADQMAQHFDDNNETVLVDANGTDNAESTESYEFANGSDETSSWESFSGHDIEEAEAMVHQDGGPCRCQNCMEMSMAHSARIMERSTHTDFELSDNVVKIETDDGCKIYVVGTAHFSMASQEDVSQTIQTVCPDVVMVELCGGRVSIIQYDEETLLREAKDISMAKLKMAIKESGFVGGVMQLLLLSMSAHLTKQLGMAPGGEFRRAVKEAKKIPGCQVLLGDRPVQITLSRAMAALSFWQKLKMGWCLLTSRDPISKEDIEKFKQKDMLAEILKEMTGDYPMLTKVFVNERDLYMAHTLRKAARPVPIVDETGAICGHEPAVVVGVVGLGHLNGIKENFGKHVDMVDLLKVPKPSASSKIFKYTFRAFLVAAISWGVFKLVKWTGVC